MEPDEQNLALSQGLLGLGAGLLSGSYGHYGQFAPALGQGMAGFQHNYSQAQQMSLHSKMFAQQKLLQDAQIGNYDSEVKKRNADMLEQERLRALGINANQAADKLLAPPQSQLPPTVPKIVNGQGWTMGQGGSTGNGGPLVANAPSVFNGVMDPKPIGQNELAPVEVTGTYKSNLTNPDWHMKRAEYLYANGDLKGAQEAAKQAQELRGEEMKLNAAPATKMVPVGNDMEQMFEWDRNKQTWMKQGEPRHIFTQTPLVKLDMTQETAAAAKMGTTDAETVGSYQQAAMAGQKLLPVLKRMENNVDKTFSGVAANFATDLGNLATSLGVGNPDLLKKVATSEQAVADIAELVRGKIKALGSGTAISNMDLLFTNKSVPDLLKTPTGRKMIIRAMKADIQNVVNDHQAARQWFDSHGKSLAGFVPPSASAEPVDFGDMGAKTSAPKLMKGQAVDGYTYKGGDPSEESSWERQ